MSWPRRPGSRSARCTTTRRSACWSRRGGARGGTGSTPTTTSSASTASACCAGSASRSARSAEALDDPAWSLRAAMATHLADLDRAARGGATGCGSGRPARAGQPQTGADWPSSTDDLLDVLEEMTMLDTDRATPDLDPRVRRTSSGCYDFLVRVFGLGPGRAHPRRRRATSSTASSRPATASSGSTPRRPSSGWRRPAPSGRSTASVAVMVDDVDAHFRHAVRAGRDHRLRARRPALRLPRVQRPRQRRRPLVVHEAARSPDSTEDGQ